MNKKRGTFKKLAPNTPPPLKLDFGCGPNPKEGFEGVDQYPFDGKVKHVLNIVARAEKRTNKGGVVMVEPKGAFAHWPWADGSIAEAHASHFVEHLTALERVHFANELYRILVPGGQCQIIAPHFASCRAYGDPTHQWPPVSEFWAFYLSREWRMGDPAKGLAANAPHTDRSINPDGFNCNFTQTHGFGLRQDLVGRALDYQQFAIANYKEAATDLIISLTKA